MSHRALLTVGLALASALVPAAAQTMPNEADLKALGTAYALYLGATYLKDTCAKRDPASAAKVGQAYAAWVKAQNLGSFEAQLGKRLGAATLGQLKQELNNGMGDLDAALQKLGPASQSCPALSSQFSTDIFNVRQKVPNLSALLAGTGSAGSGSTGTGTPATGKAAGGTTGSSTAGGNNPAASITVYSVAQLSGLMAQTVAAAKPGQQDDVGLAKLKSLGPIIAVTGTITSRYNSISQKDGYREAKYHVYCYDMANDADDPPKNKQITVAGRIREFDHDTGAVIESCVLLSANQIAQLKKSTLAVTDAAWFFPSQPAEKFLVAAGQGLKDSEILGAFIEQAYGVGVGGMTIPTVPIALFLKDGTVYNDPYWAPGSFNYKLSRQIEPQKWGKWTRQGNKFFIKWGDGDTHTFEVVGSPKLLAAGTKLSGAFQTISGGGTTAIGGDVIVAGGSNYAFKPDGTFTGGRFGGGSSGGGVSGSGQVSVSSSSKMAGTYSISGYSITLKMNGEEKRLFFARNEDGLLYIGGAPYTTDK